MYKALKLQNETVTFREYICVTGKKKRNNKQ